MRVMSLETLFKLHGGQRHPRIQTYEVLQKGSHLTEYRYAPHGLTNPTSGSEASIPIRVVIRWVFKKKVDARLKESS